MKRAVVWMFVAGCGTSSMSSDSDHVGGGLGPDPHDGAADAVDGKVTLCHATDPGSYVFIRVDVNGCVHGHAKHKLDFLSPDPSCRIASPPPVAVDDGYAVH